jgi:tripeptide aminopeptidase
VTVDVVELFRELAAIPSPSRHERRVAERVQAELGALGLEAELQLLDGTGTGNLLVRLEATAPGVPLLFCAHLDTVPPDGPLDPVVEDGVLRNAGGTILGADDKAAVAVLLAVVRGVVEARRPHAGLEILFTCQEEIGLQGAKAFDFDTLDAEAGFVFDDASPVGTVVVTAPYQENVLVTFRGRAAHAGLAPEDGRSAIVAAARAVAAMPNGRVDPDTTANVGVIGGGVARNVVAAECSIEADVRSYAPGRARELVTELLEHCTRAAESVGCTVESETFEGYPGYRLRSEDLPVRLATGALRRCGHDPELISSGGGVDANVVNARGIPTANLGNGMAHIHTSDETIAAADLVAMVDVALALVDGARAAQAAAAAG